MAQQKALRLAFCKLSISSLSGILSSSYGGKLATRHLWTRGNTKEGIFPRASIIPEQGFISKYSTSAKYSSASGDRRGKARQEQISGSLADDSGSTWIYLVGLGGIITIVGGYFIYHSNERMGPIKARKPHSTRKEFSDQKTTIGGPFTLTNHEGDVVTSKDLTGHWTLIYFGYTSCPDDCPEELQKLAEAVETIDKQARDKIIPVFITLDPKRDSAAQLQAYLYEFHPSFVGLTGTADSVRQVAREYRVFYKKVEDEGSDYLVDHSNLVYLMDPNMEFVKVFGREYDARSLSMGIIEEMKKYKSVSVI